METREKSSDCIFCKIGAAKKNFIAETKHLFAVFDISPVTPGHAMVIPKRHAVTMFEMNEEEGKELGKILTDVKKVIEGKHKPKGYNIGSNNGEVAGQAVMHMHIHVIPRYKGHAGIHILGNYDK